MTACNIFLKRSAKITFYSNYLQWHQNVISHSQKTTHFILESIRMFSAKATLSLTPFERFFLRKKDALYLSTNKAAIDLYS